MRTILFICTLCFSSFGEGIPHYRLEWSDFKGTPDCKKVKNGMTGYTCTEWILGDSSIDSKTYYTLTCRVVPEKSWITNRNPELLEHERLHWAISIMNYRRFEYWLNKHQGSAESDKKQIINEFNKHWRLSQRLQGIYDRDTNHGLNRVTQGIWDRNIHKTLETTRPE